MKHLKNWLLSIFIIATIYGMLLVSSEICTLVWNNYGSKGIILFFILFLSIIMTVILKDNEI